MFEEDTHKHDEPIAPTGVDPNEEVLIAFVNGKSGGGLGQKVIKKLKEIIPPDRVYDLMDKPIGPEKGLRVWRNHKNLKVIAAGGDGTVGWILSVFDKMGWEQNNYPPVAVLPLGTGNDMSRILRWGGGSDGEHLKSYVDKVRQHSVPIKLDRWHLRCVPLTPSEIDKLDEHRKKAREKRRARRKAKKKEKLSMDKVKEPKELKEMDKPKEINMVINNYFSVGVGAQIIEDFDSFRNKHPSLISSRLVGKGWYGALSFRRMVKPGTPVKRVLEDVKLDGKPLKISSKIQEFTILNIPSIMGGADVWGKYSDTSCQKSEPTVCDKYFELVGLKGVSHMARLKAGVSAGGGIRIGQGQTLEFMNRRTMRAQVDGEALLLVPCKISISLHNQGTLLLNTHEDKGNAQLIKLQGKNHDKK
eukprot:TRINITY_DN4520_c0_g1_i1.p1 TRINITY_DN4520_c0_g1~~TRINITY_DN4520_c0_g1_i1.p1  ORF type:complete len:471 (-),score=108.54 TRINITY_DN4520_c0_g1_i1:67-1314(-)